MFRTTFATYLVALSISLVSADRTTEAGEQAITDPVAECTPYGYPLVANAIASFPTIWQPATIVANDAAAQAKWASIQGSIPNIAPKGTLQGDFSGTTPNYPPSDPDCWWTYSQCTTSKTAGIPADIAVMPEPSTLGYGFDDGPNCSHNAFYDYLTSQNQKATMFYIGSNVMDWPLEAQRAVSDGHEICAHTWSHHYMTAFSSEDAFAEIYYSMQAIKLVAGVTPTCWRPPFGDIDDRIRSIADALGLRTVLWKYNSNDWQAGTNGVTPANVDTNYQNMINDANNGLFSTVGTMILTHELNNFTMSEAIKFYPQLKAAFKNIVPVGVGLNISHPYIEFNYTLPSFSEYVSGSRATQASPADIAAASASAAAASAAAASSSKVASTAKVTTVSGPASTTSASSSASSATTSVKSGANSLRVGWTGSSVNSLLATLVLAFVGAAIL